MNKVIKWALIVLSICLVVYVFFLVYIETTWNDPLGKTYTKQDLIANYKERKEKLLSAEAYLQSIAPANKEVEIEFSDNSALARFCVENIDSISKTPVYPIFLQWNLQIISPVVDSVLSSLNWSRQTLEILKAKLDSAHCISIKTGEPCQIGFQRSGFGMYFYDIFSKPMSDSLKSRYNNGCTYIYYDPVLVLEYGGGAIGPQCFPRQ